MTRGRTGALPPALSVLFLAGREPSDRPGPRHHRTCNLRLSVRCIRHRIASRTRTRILAGSLRPGASRDQFPEADCADYSRCKGVLRAPWVSTSGRPGTIYGAYTLENFVVHHRSTN